MKTYIVQLEPHDDVISTRDKISWSKAARVLLVWPRKGTVLERRVDLLLLLRHARQLGAQLALVSHSPEVKDQATDLGIPVFATALEAQRVAWRRPRKAIRWRRLRRGRKARDPQSLRGMREGLRPPSVENRWLRLAAFFTGVLAFLSLVAFFAPGARVELVPERADQQLEIELWAGPSIPVANPSGGVPAHPITVVVEGRDQVESTGSTAIPNKPAAGEVLLTNLTDQEVDVPQSTVVLMSGNFPVRYLTQTAVKVPAGPGQSQPVPVEAVLPGRTGNLAAGQVLALEGPLGLRVTAENLAAIGGGLDRAGPAPSRSDYQRLKAKLFDHLQNTALEEIRAQVGPSQRLLEGTLVGRTIVEETLEPAIDEPGDQLSLTLRVEYEAWVVEETDLQAVGQAALDANLEKGKQSVPNTVRVTFLEPAQREANLPVPVAAGGANDTETNEIVRWPVRVERQVEANWSEQEAVRSVLGRRVDEAGHILSTTLALAGTPRITVFPAWWPRLPFLPFRVEVIRP